MKHLYPLLLLPLAACTPDEAAPPAVGLANPAAVFCVNEGGRVEIVTSAEGEHGLCHLPDGSVVEEWAYFRAHAPAQEQ